MGPLQKCHILSVASMEAVEAGLNNECRYSPCCVFLAATSNYSHPVYGRPYPVHCYFSGISHDSAV